MPFAQQSPINLHDPIYAELGDKRLEIRWNGVIPGCVVKDDHGLKVRFASDARRYIRLGGKSYHLVSFHFHHPSEHWEEGEAHR
jgi:carbonic anhydrase